MTPATALPTLRFRLPGRWHQVDLASAESIQATVRAVVAEVVGRRDQDAVLRARIRGDLVEAADAALSGGATSLMFSTELTPGTPMPVTLTVFLPDDLRMSPTVGTESAAVLATFAEGIKALDPAAFATLQHVRYDGGPAMRTHAVVEQLQQEADREVSIRRLSADYWLPVPGTKRLALVNLATPMGEIADVMLSFFDALVSVAWFDPS